RGSDRCRRSPTVGGDGRALGRHRMHAFQSGKLSMTSLPFLRIPPFPGHRAQPLAQPLAQPMAAPRDGIERETSAEALLAALRECRVGAAFWRPTAQRPSGRDIVLHATERDAAAMVLAHAHDVGLIDRAFLSGSAPSLPNLLHLDLEVDPWNL